MKDKYEVIVIGGGHNGLTAATMLAKKGKSVLVLEKNKKLGGIAAGREFLKGYNSSGLLHDTSAVRKSVIDAFELKSQGLQSTGHRPSVAILGKNGHGIHLINDIDACANEISKHSSKDAAAYKDYRNFINDIGNFLYPLLNEIPPDLSNFGTKELFVLAKKGLALKRLGKATMNELLKVAPMCVADFLNERFETEFLKAGLLAPSIYGSYTGPWSSYTTLNLLIWECCAREHVIGGPQALVDSLEKAARGAGVEIQIDAAVTKILLDKNRKVAGVRINDEKEVKTNLVAASCTPQETILNLFAPNEIEYSLEKSIQNYRARGTTAKVNIALKNKAEFKFKSDTQIEFARTGNSIDEMEKAFDSVKYRSFSDEPILDIHIPTISNPTLAPEGHDVVSVLVHFTPHHFDAGWNEVEKERLGHVVFETLEKYMTNIKIDLAGHEILTPLDLEHEYHLTNGHIYHGEHAVDQLITRPFPSSARYETSIPGLYFCGSGSHPGGGITCAPGALGAKKILMDI